MKKKSTYYTTFIAGLLLTLLFSCKKEADIPTVKLSMLTFAWGYSFSGEITSDGGAAVTERGFCWSTSPNPTTASNKTAESWGTPNYFNGYPNGLRPGTAYYISAFATNKIGTGYSNQQSFRTLNETLTFDDDVYRSVTIGTQVWLDQNLKTTKYRNGDPISNVTDGAAWSNLDTGAYCLYNNDAATYKSAYGAFYNWYAVTDIRNIAPDGWHVATDAEWATLINYLGGESIAGGKMKEIGPGHWASSNTDATNSSGFTALPSGLRTGGNGMFDFLGSHSYYWSYTGDAASTAWSRDLSYNSANVLRTAADKKNGYSVRCVKD